MKRNKYEEIEQVLNNIPDKYSILEDEVDLDIQKEYFEMSETLDFDINIDEISQAIEQLSNDQMSLKDRKLLLLKLASIDSVEAYRAIEKYKSQCDNDIRGWASLALQQSKMVIESELVGEDQVFISTGLGGKGDKLRYFLAFPYTNGEATPTQKKIAKSEIVFFIEKYEGNVESVDVHDQYVAALALIPLKAQIADLIDEFMEECNQFGNFLNEDDLIITNVKKMSETEIEDVIALRRSNFNFRSDGAFSIS